MQGCEIQGYIDIRERIAGNCINGRIVRHYKDLPSESGSFILVYVRKRDAREEIREYLNTSGRI